MAHGKLKAGLVLGLVVVVTLGSFMTYRWVNRTFGKAPSASAPNADTPSNNKEASAPPMASPPIVISGAVMAQAFRNGQLPAPLGQPVGTPEQAAAELAKRVMAEDEQSTAALLTALQMSGFSVRGDDGSLAFESVKPGQGILIDAWEVAALAKLFGDGMQIRLTNLSNSFASTVPSLKGAPVADLLLDGLRHAAQSDQPAMRFWAEFIAELGRQSATPYDLLASNLDTAKVDLDAIQVSLVLRRLVADMMVLQGSEDHIAEFAPAWQRDSTSPRWKPAAYKFEGGEIRDAVWRYARRPHLRLVQEGGGGSKLPCSLKELEAQILDVTAYSYMKGFDTMLEYMSEHGMKGAEKYGKAASGINAVLALIKLIAYYACMETDITMSGNPPLVRTQSIYEPGEKRTLTATVRENIGKWQAMNCARIALNGANFDISLPNDGPVAGVKTQWMLTSGGTSVSNNVITYPFVQFVSPDGTPRIQDAMVPISNASAPKTDEEGHTTIDIEGVKQREKLNSPVPLMKQAEVRFTCSAKPVTMSQDLIDAVGNGLGGPIGTFIGGPVEMLLRSDIHMSKKLLIPVKDWESCDGGWAGTITYTRSSHSVNNSNDGGWNKTFAKDHTEREDVRLSGNPNSAKGWDGTSAGTFIANVNAKTLAIDRQGSCTCTADETFTAVGGGEAVFEISPEGDNKYTINGRTTATFPSVDLVRRSCSGCPPASKPGPDTNSTGTYSASFGSFTVQEDPNQPGVLHGSTSLPTTRAGDTNTVSWNLTQCKDRR
jgi:hypothetical protein